MVCLIHHVMTILLLSSPFDSCMVNRCADLEDLDACRVGLAKLKIEKKKKTKKQIIDQIEIKKKSN